MVTTNRLTIFLLVTGGISGFAALFAPGESWGADLGSTGATVFALTLVAAVALFAVRGDRVFPDAMSVVERRAWVGLVFLVLIFAAFARELSALVHANAVPESITDGLSRQFMFRCLLLLAAWAAIEYLVGRSAAIESDERDLQMRHRADRAGHWTLTFVVAGGIILLATFPRGLLDGWLTPIVLANLLIGLLMTKSLVEHVALAYQYRRA